MVCHDHLNNYSCELKWSFVMFFSFKCTKQKLQPSNLIKILDNAMRNNAFITDFTFLQSQKKGMKQKVSKIAANIYLHWRKSYSVAISHLC